MRSKLTIISIVLLLGIIIAAGSIAPVAAGKTAEKEALIKVFTHPPDQRRDLFAESFLNQVPISNINNIITQYKSKLGELESIKSGEGPYTLIFEKGTAPSRVSLNTEGEIAGLWFGNWTLKSDTLDKLVSELKDLDSSVSLYLSKNGEELYSLNKEEKMAVGSTFKLYVLQALYDKFESDVWNKVVWLKKKDISLPSGVLQDWPVGTPITVKTLSNLMISQSDNTATDILIELVGKKYLEQNTNPRNRPFLTTVEAFNLKYGVDSTIRKDYVTGNTRQKREILESFQGLRVSASQVTASTPTLIEEVEWFFSTKELAEIIYDLRDAGEIYINTGLATKSDWYRAGYKGGSEGGVLQYTHLLQKSKDSPVYVISLTANNPEKGLNTSKITEIASRLIALVKDGKL
ncbi:serine hydrolase [Candidatus Bipolaricaulota bacterium]|nr:serine hydrolase [Candidatus Bipolaricaulota bacterium]MBS3792718.1 serine hydrolase [Candidatus Bipolaricaulota bacterium]